METLDRLESTEGALRVATSLRGHMLREAVADTDRQASWQDVLSETG